MVLSRKRFTPKKPNHPGQAGGSRKRFASPASSDTKKKPGHVGGARKTMKQGMVMHETCVACHREGRKEKVEIRDVREESFKGKGATMRKRLVGKCEHGHKWFRFAKST